MQRAYDYSTLIDVLQLRATQQPDKPVYRFLLDGEDEEIQYTYAELDQRARAIGALLQRQGAAGERVLLLYQPGLDYIAAFFGCLYAGAVAVPAYPPNPARMERTLPRLLAIVADARPAVALTTAQILEVAGMLSAEVPEFAAVQWHATDTLSDELAASWQAPAIDGATLAFLQYTSGSTATPKGVMLSHANLLHNSQLIQRGFATTPESRGVFWLPFYHDMGLIGGLIQPIYCGGTSMLMSPVSFLQRPLRWLEAVSGFQADISGGPNFAYDLCVRKATTEQLARLDLSHWRVAFNGAEPIRAETLERFAATFAPCGFRREAFYPCYGLAEATLMVSGVAPTAPPLVQAFDAAALERGQAMPSESVARARTLVGSGQPLQHVAIVQPETQRRCAPGQVGEIWVSSPSIAGGYWNQPAESERSFGARLADDPAAGPFLRTGDLGFLHQGELCITGRSKDLIIIRGRNHYPQDIELTVEQSHPALRAGCGAAVAVEVAGEERLVIVQEVERQHRNVDVEVVADAIRQAVAQGHELHVYAVVLLRQGTIPKTSSGKIQRHACRAEFLAGTLETLGTSQRDERPTSPTVQLTRAALLAAPPEERQLLLEGYMQALVAQAVQVAPAQISLERPVSSVGLDSLMAVELQHTLENDLAVVVSMVSFLQDHSLSQLAAEVLAELERADGPAPLVASKQASSSTPLTPGQRAIWFLHQLAPESAAYTIASAVRIAGPLDVPALQRSFEQLLDRHPALRSTFHLMAGEPVQQVQAEAELAFTVQDASNWSEGEVQAALQQAAQQPFDLEHGPLLRLHLLARAADEHVLLVAVHHSVSDLWSLATLTNELGQIYPAQCAGRAAPLAPLPLDFGDYVRWQHELLAGSEGERLWQFWRGQLDGAATTLNLPPDRPRPPLQTYNGAAYQFSLSATVTAGLKALAEAQHATLYHVLLAAFEVLLYRYSGQADFLIGTPTAGRSRAELSGLVGYFVNSVVLRADMAGEPRFSDLLGRVRQTSLAAFAHGDYPFVSLVERMGLQRDLSRSPLFQVMFALQKAHAREQTDLTAFAVGAEASQIQVGELQFAPFALPQTMAQFDLSLAMGEVHGGMVATLEYNSDLFDGATARRMAQHLETILAAVVADPQQLVDDLPLLSQAERQQLLLEWSSGDTTPIPALCIHQLFAAQAQRSPDAVAVISGADQMRYGELDERANSLARRLRGLGVGPETLVGICAERSVEMMVGILAILKAGGAYVPLDPTYPAERLSFILHQTGAPVLLADQEIAEGRLQIADWHGVICSLQSLASATELDSLPPVAEPTPDNAACVIYTSGSTGQPKGVVLTHHGIVNLIESFVRSYEPGSSDRMLPLTSLASASFVGEIFPPLCTGGALVLPNALEVLDFEALFALMRQRHVTMLSAVPSLIARLNGRADQLPELRLLLSGGEALAYSDINRLVQTTTISNGYGLTETTVCSTFYHVNPQRPPTSSYIPIGRPLLNTQVYILDERMHPVPIGVPGELYVGGMGLARGYFADPALTAQRFLVTGDRRRETEVTPSEQDRLASVVGLPSPVYKTGDRARWLPDGLIEYVGRSDHQVKLRGFRIELGEIETVLSQHPAVHEAFVTAREDTPGNKRLVAYVVLQNAETQRRRDAEDGLEQASAIADTQSSIVNPPALRPPLSLSKGLSKGQSLMTNGQSPISNLQSHLRERLPAYMVPAAIVLLERMPLTPNGKVDVRRLPAPSDAHLERSAAFLAPRSELEHQIAAVWQAALKVEHVGIHDNFFELGGHSLLLVQVHSELRASYPQLTLIDMFRHPTVGTLAAHLGQGLPAEPSFAEFQDRAQKQKAFRDRRKELARNRAGS
ncbi:MAG: amino acid adenylation domain-containing protein [Chloroflexaceae bacterium]|nr:amino acid adenylation domain-containing protein [Chloroflexaceae bacterium]